MMWKCKSIHYSDIKRVEATEKELQRKIDLLKKEEEGMDENSEVFETSVDLGCPSTGTSTPQTLIA